MAMQLCLKSFDSGLLDKTKLSAHTILAQHRKSSDCELYTYSTHLRHPNPKQPTRRATAIAPEKPDGFPVADACVPRFGIRTRLPRLDTTNEISNERN